MTRRVLTIAASSALLASGCGGEETTEPFTGPDPATVTPAEAPLFLESVVRPEGDQRAALEGALSKLLATDDPGGFIIQQLDQALKEAGGGITYEDDIEPWLGSRAGLFLETFTEDAKGAFIVATTDDAATRRAIEEIAAAERTPERRRTYEGVDYEVDRNGDAAGIVGSFLVAGPEAAFRDAVDASQGGSLAESGEFESQLDAAPDGLVAFAYAEPQAVVDALKRSGQVTPAALRSAGLQLYALVSAPATASISATSDQLALEASAAAGGELPASQESPLLRELPGDSWLAFAASDAGDAYAQALQQGRFLQGWLGFDLSAQLGEWLGDAGGFVRGSSLFGLGGAVVLETGDVQASARTLDDLQAALSGYPDLDVSPLEEEGEEGFSVAPAGVPVQFQFVQRDDRVIAGLGSQSIEDVLSPSSTLKDSGSFTAAAGALGGNFAPVAFVDFEPLFQLVDAFPDAASDPGYQQAKPYLESLDYLVLGAGAERDQASGRAVLGLRDALSSADGLPREQGAAMLDPSALAP